MNTEDLRRIALRAIVRSANRTANGRPYVRFPSRRFEFHFSIRRIEKYHNYSLFVIRYSLFSTPRAFPAVGQPDPRPPPRLGGTPAAGGTVPCSMFYENALFPKIHIVFHRKFRANFQLDKNTPQPAPWKPPPYLDFRSILQLIRKFPLTNALSRAIISHAPNCESFADRRSPCKPT